MPNKDSTRSRSRPEPTARKEISKPVRPVWRIFLNLLPVCWALARCKISTSGYWYPRTAYDNSPFLFIPDEIYESPTVSFQVTVSHVCRAWRNVAINTPSLWSWIHFHELPHIERANVFLSRCRPRHAEYTDSHLLDILISTVSEDEHENNPNTLYDDELNTIFELLVKCISRWRSFHLYVRDGNCKATARKYLSSCGAAPNLKTLQLYHFEQFQTPDDLHRATYRPPVVCFSNVLPGIKNVSLIGVNMPWRRSENDTANRSPSDNFKMDNLESIQLGLHSDNIRPPYHYWEQMLQCSPELQHLSLHYSGPKRQDETRPETLWPPSPLSQHRLDIKPSLVSLPSLTHLSLTDLEECSYTCDILERLRCEKVAVLQLGVMDELDLETGDFSKLLELIIGDKCPFPMKYLDHRPTMTYFPTQPLPNIQQLHTLVLKSFACSFSSLRALLITLLGLKVLEIDFLELHLTNDGREAWQAFVVSVDHRGPCVLRSLHFSADGRDDRSTTCPCLLLPSLECFSVNGLVGQNIIDIVNSRVRVNTTIRSLTRRNPAIPEVKLTIPRYVVKYDEAAKGTDTVLDDLIMNGGVSIPSFSEDHSEASPTFIPVELKLVATDESESVADDSESETSDEDL